MQHPFRVSVVLAINLCFLYNCIVHPREVQLYRLQLPFTSEHSNQIEKVNINNYETILDTVKEELGLNLFSFSFSHQL